MAQTKAELEQENAELKAQLESSTAQTEQPSGPHVVRALHTVMSELAVEKNGMLPPNMGGKSYISAVDLAYQVKLLFAREGLILLPSESVRDYQVLDQGNRKNTYMVVEGKYQIISRVDSSSVTISGTGDGIAAGSAVTSNIASTNALKNALLRTFLVTEQSAEDAAKNGPGEGGSSQNPAMQKAAQPRQQTPPQAAPPAQSDAQRKVREEFIENADSGYTRDQVNALMDQVKNEGDFRGDKLFDELLRRLRAGEVA